MGDHERFMSYISAYARKDLHSVSNMFAEDVRLRDWNLSVQGKQAAISETANNFEAARSIDIEVLATHESRGAVAGELRILVNGDTELHVVDVVEFNEWGHISAIRAYLGRASE